MRARVTIRGEGTELRGYVGGEDVLATLGMLSDFATSVERFGWAVVVSPEEDDYDPFVGWST